MADKDPLLSLSEAADLLLVDKRTVQLLAKDGWVKKNGRGAYPLRALVQGFIRYQRDVAQRSTQKAVQDRLHEIKIEVAEIDLATKKRELVPTEDAIALVERIVGMLSSEFRTLSARYTRDLKRRKKLAALIDDILQRSAERVSKLGDALRAGRDDTDADAEDESG